MSPEAIRALVEENEELREELRQIKIDGRLRLPEAAR